MTTEHEVFSDEYVSSQTKRYKQGTALFTVFVVIFGTLGMLAMVVAIATDNRSLTGMALDFVVLSFVSMGITAIARGRHETLLENKRLWDRATGSGT